MGKHATKLVPVDFSDMDGWPADDHAAAFRAFLKSCRKAPDHDAASAAARALPEAIDRESARALFEIYSVPHAVKVGAPGFVTGYYEPEVQGARERNARFDVPIYARPDDFVTLAAGDCARKVQRPHHRHARDIRRHRALLHPF